MSARFSKPLLAVAFTVSFAFIGAQVPASAATATPADPCSGGNPVGDILSNCSGLGHGVDIITGKCADPANNPGVCTTGAPAIGSTSTGSGTGPGTGSGSGSGSGGSNTLIKLCFRNCTGEAGTLVDSCFTGCTEP